MNTCALLEGVTPQASELAQIKRLEHLVKQMPQVELPTKHLFADGMYARILPRQKGTLIIGKVHRREHFYIVASGKVQVGKDVYEAGTVIVSKPGTKRAVLALEDSVCLTVHRTKKRNLEQIEKQLIEPDETALFDSENKMKALK
jgi:hypothetical protein